MTLLETITEDMISAMKRKDSFSLGVIRMAKGAVSLEAINKKRDLTDEEVVDVIVKQIKLRKDAILEFTKANRMDLVSQNEKEIEVLNKYLPEQLSSEEVIQIIDDAFNSNPEGSKMALEVLDLMDGYKVIVTPGMIELGERQNDLNKEFGRYISDVADMVILVGEKQTKPILEGLIDKHYDRDKIFVINDVKDAFKLVCNIDNKNVYVLLENDLPDIFNEGGK